MSSDHRWPRREEAREEARGDLTVIVPPTSSASIQYTRSSLTPRSSLSPFAPSAFRPSILPNLFGEKEISALLLCLGWLASGGITCQSQYLRNGINTNARQACYFENPHCRRSAFLPVISQSHAGRGERLARDERPKRVGVCGIHFF